MPWYLAYAYHGPGHQSQTTEHRWSENELSEEDKASLWDEVFGCGSDYDWPIGGVAKLDGLPKNIREVKIQETMFEIEELSSLLSTLKSTPEIEHYMVNTKYDLCSCGERHYKCRMCGKRVCYSFSGGIGDDFLVCPKCRTSSMPVSEGE